MPQACLPYSGSIPGWVEAAFSSGGGEAYKWFRRLVIVQNVYVVPDTSYLLRCWAWLALLFNGHSAEAGRVFK